MNTVENALLKQMKKLAAGMTAIQNVVNKDKGEQASVSFQEMLQKSGSKTSETVSDKEPQDKPAGEEGEVSGEKVPVLKKDKEELKPEQLAANPNAVNVLDLFRPEIVEANEQAGTVLEPIPQEAVPEAAMDLSGQGFELEAGVDSGVGAEVSMDQQPREFRQTMEEAPRQEESQAAEAKREAPAQAAEKAEKPEREPEVRAARDEDVEEPAGETAAPERPVFYEAQAVPVKVGERYEAVDTQEPEMDAQLASVIRDAAQSGQERIEIRLNPQNLGSLVIEMTKDADGALQVVLHAATPKAEGLLNQHLNGLHTALQGYGHEEVRLEVQRGQQSEQQNFRQADPDGRGRRDSRQQQERREEQRGGDEFMQKLRLGLFGAEN